VAFPATNDVSDNIGYYNSARFKLIGLHEKMDFRRWEEVDIISREVQFGIKGDWIVPYHIDSG